MSGLIRIITVLLSVFSLLWTLSATVQAEDWESRFIQADDKKSSDPQYLFQTLSRAAGSMDELSSRERYFYRYLQAYAKAYRGDYNAAIIIFEELSNEAEFADLQIRVQATLINVYVLTNRFVEAFYLAEQLMHRLDSQMFDEAVDRAYRILALVYNEVERYETAQFLASQSYQARISPQSQCISGQLLAQSMFHLEQYDDFMPLSSQVLSLCNDIGETVFANLTAALQAKLYISQAQFGLAEMMLSGSYEQVMATGYPYLIDTYHYLLGTVYIEQGKYDEALEFLLRSHKVESTRSGSQYEPLMKIYQHLSYISKQREDYQLALQYLELHLNYMTKYYHMLSQRQVAFEMVRSEMQLKNQTISLLNKDNQLLYLQSEILSKEAQNARLLIGLFLALFLVAGVLAYRGLTGRHRFKQMAEFDELTGISNRYHFNKMAEEALSQCKKNNMTMGVVMFDLDHFKHINDSFGHAVGDWVLKQVVDSCRNFMRLDDIFGRLGGEEFAILLPGCHADKALMLAEICRDAIEDIDTSVSGHEFLLTASFGVTSTDGSGYDLTQLLADADAAMYQAKKLGRNQVHFFTGRGATDPSA